MQITNKFYSTYTPYKHQEKQAQIQPTQNFTSNPDSKKLAFKTKDFFINIYGYGKNTEWASKVKEIADNAVGKIRKNNSSDKVLSEIAEGMKEANSLCIGNKNKAAHTGILRTFRRGYGETGTWANSRLQTPFGENGSVKYKPYNKRLAYMSDHPLKNPYYDISLTRILYSPVGKNGEMGHGSPRAINNALDRVGGKYFNLQRKYIQHPEKVTKDTLPEINEEIAEIRWIMAHATPWERGSDAISNTFMRSLYKSMGIKTYPSKKKVSFDLEAYCTELKDYKKNFTNFFDIPPTVIE